MLNSKLKREKRFRHHKRVRVKISGTSKVPRLCVFKSAKHIYAQLIDDEKGRTLAAAGDLKLNLKTELPKEANQRDKSLLHSSLRLGQVKMRTLSSSPSKSPSLKVSKEEKTEETKKPLRGKVALAYGVGKLVAKKALEKKIEKIVFDRGGYRYLGRVRALAEGAREGGLKF